MPQPVVMLGFEKEICRRHPQERLESVHREHVADGEIERCERQRQHREPLRQQAAAEAASDPARDDDGRRGRKGRKQAYGEQ